MPSHINCSLRRASSSSKICSLLFALFTVFPDLSGLAFSPYISIRFTLGRVDLCKFISSSEISGGTTNRVEYVKRKLSEKISLIFLNQHYIIHLCSIKKSRYCNACQKEKKYFPDMSSPQKLLLPKSKTRGKKNTQEMRETSAISSKFQGIF